MPADSQPTTSEESHQAFTPRKVEMDALAELLPLQGVEGESKRIFNIWGEPKVGKSTFISSFRESEAMLAKKVLWIQPTRNESLDTIPEFIRACSATIRYPAEPGKERKISNQLESVQRGKVNPIVSDDSILITRSSIAKDKKPYINQAAASSVGRTETAREDVEISVGLGESKANNQAEGFLDALPLQSLGTDLTIIYLEKIESLSVSILDWLRDYVIPAATRGPYRRSVVFLIESLDPIKAAYPNESWGEWSNRLYDFRLYPLSQDDTYQIALSSGVDASSARYIRDTSLGYPILLRKGISEYKSGAFEPDRDAKFEEVLERLSASDRVQLAALCLPDQLYADELDALLGPNKGAAAFKWLRSLGIPFSKSADSVALQLPQSLRRLALDRAQGEPEFDAFIKRWIPLGKLVVNAPLKADRSKLLMLSGLYWMNQSCCNEIFGEKAENVFNFIQSKPLYFNAVQDRFRVSERFRPELQRVASNQGNPSVSNIHEKASALWNRRREKIEERIEALEAELEARQSESLSLSRRQSESLAQSRIHGRRADGSTTTAKRSNGSLLLLTTLLAIALFAAGSLASYPFSAGLLGAGLVSLTLAIAYLPKWLIQRRSNPAGSPNSPDFFRAQNLEINHKAQACEDQIDELKSELAAARLELKFAYVSG